MHSCHQTPVCMHPMRRMPLARARVQALEWWYSSGEEQLAASKALPPPPPPPPPLPSRCGVGLPADPTTCPVCRCATRTTHHLPCPCRFCSPPGKRMRGCWAYLHPYHYPPAPIPPQHLSHEA